MSANNRAQLINKLFKVAKKHYTASTPPSNRPVLEHMLYACCLENSPNEAADEAFARLEQNFFDWNEVRVTTTKELAESMKGLTQPDAAATSLKKTLHGIFETWYKFDLDFLRKENLRKTVDEIAKFRGVGPFIVSYTGQIALGGHYIPLDNAMISLFVVLGIISESEADKERVPGLERTIPKNKGVEFASVVHQLAAAFFKSPHNKDLRSILTSISPDASERFPKRMTKKPAAKKKAAPKKAAVAAKPEKKKPARKAVKAAVKKKPTKAATRKKKPVAKKSPTTTRKKKLTAAGKKSSTAKSVSKKKAAKSKKSISRKAKSVKSKSATRKLARKKPR